MLLFNLSRGMNSQSMQKSLILRMVLDGLISHIIQVAENFKWEQQFTGMIDAIGNASI